MNELDEYSFTIVAKCKKYFNYCPYAKSPDGVIANIICPCIYYDKKFCTNEKAVIAKLKELLLK